MPYESSFIYNGLYSFVYLSLRIFVSNILDSMFMFLTNSLSFDTCFGLLCVVSAFIVAMSLGKGGSYQIFKATKA